MGYFSWKTQDTDRSICNRLSSRITFSVTMKDNKGNSWTDENYDGYGNFGGKDFYELLAEMNGKKTRTDGINIWFGDEPFISPNLNEDPDLPWTDSKPEECEDQGFFYYDGEDEDEEYDDYYL